MLICVISDINQVVHRKIAHQILIFTAFLISLGVQIREGACTRVFIYFQGADIGRCQDSQLAGHSFISVPYRT